MSTDDVLDAIDHALGDWSVSGDAMRWTPEPAVTPTVRRPIVLHTAVDLRGFNEAMAEVARRLADWAVSVNQAAVGVEQFMDRFNREDAHQRWHVVPLAEPEEDARTRALALRQNRHTGPERAPAGQQKRPRKLS